MSTTNGQLKTLDCTPSILDSISSDLEYKSVTDRYFSRRYCINVKDVPKNDHLLLFHSNRICLVTLAPSHPLYSNNSEFTIDFQVGNVDRSKNWVKGKGKKGGQLLDTSSTICKVVCKNGAEYNISSCINGKLIEINEMLLTKPMLLKTHPDSDGYIAVVLANIATSESRKEELLNEEKYLESVSAENEAVL